MRTVGEHLDAVLALGATLAPKALPLGNANGLVLARDVVATFAVPPFDNSAMDGFAVRSSDVAHPPRTLRVVDDIAAGAYDSLTLSAGECARIMTGAPMPEGADSVVPVELTNARPGPGDAPDRVEIRAKISRGQHVRYQAEDVAVGEKVLLAGLTLTPAALAAAASVGHGEVTVIRRPRVGVISTGSELEKPGAALAQGQIPDSNSVLLGGLLQQFGAKVSTATVTDDPGQFRAKLEEFAQASDLVITTGGVSVGAFEVVRQVLGNGAHFGPVAMQPGKPQGMGVFDGVPVLSFPGNPVSVFVSAWLFARPLIAQLAGRPAANSWQGCQAATGWKKTQGREQYLPILLSGGKVRPAHGLGSGSHAIASLHLANGLARIPAHIESVQAGNTVEVLLTNV